MPAGKSITFMKNEYPELEGLGPDAKVSFSGEGTVNWEGDQGTLTFDSFDVQTENNADRAMKEMSGNKQMPVSNDSDEDGGI